MHLTARIIADCIRDRNLLQQSILSCTAPCRCPLCGGMGLVGWEGKWNHEEPCPMCLARRYVNCRSCGGLHHRPIFVHIRSKAQVNTVLRRLSSLLVRSGY